MKVRAVVCRSAVPEACRVGILVAALALLPLSPAPQAEASSEGCTGISDGYTCFQIHGERLHVDKFVQTRGKKFIPPDYPAICNYYALFAVEKDGKIYWSEKTEVHKGCMYSPRATRTLHVNRDFLRNSKACGSWVEDDSKLGTACNRIF
jgi:hypothetical protein